MNIYYFCLFTALIALVITNSTDHEREISAFTGCYKDKEQERDLYLSRFYEKIAYDKQYFYSIENKEKLYVGCFKDHWLERDLYYKLDNSYSQTLESCIFRCKNKNFLYAGLQFEFECFCSNIYGKYGQAEEVECDKKCPGDFNQKCGGTWRNSIYRVNLNQSYSLLNSIQHVSSYTRLSDPYYKGSEMIVDISIEKCWEKCLRIESCKAITFLHGNRKFTYQLDICFLYLSRYYKKTNDDKQYFTSIEKKI
ncbi:unnamed protein product [Brachionus calyciflorus]|uniref:WSC domain-containing protein n=1 Tax=Brachionus calyciflorus TaxID=104777 RepID=A0A814LHJ0_9BILA|nr:unnamed protein product [Brachionus calyciflorus]